MPIIKFQQHWVKISKKYACTCGHKFTRLNTDWYTLNPFNADKTEKEIREEIEKKVKEKVRDCPKCKKECKPL